MAAGDNFTPFLNTYLKLIIQIASWKYLSFFIKASLSGPAQK